MESGGGTFKARELTERFKALAERLSELVATEQVSIAAYSGSGPSHFANLSNDKKEATLVHFSKYVEVLGDAVDNGVRLRDDRKLLWRAFGVYGMRPLADLLTYESGDDDVVEIYNRDSVQIFRNVHFFRVCSYTIDDVISRPFYELYRRDGDITYKILETASELLAGKYTSTYWYDLPPHRLDEIDSPGRFLALVENRFLSPLHGADGSIQGMVSVNRALAIDTNRRRQH